jgi:SAM-dependent methyltransferase
VKEGDVAEAERERLLAEYGRRRAQGRPDLYAPWQPAVLFSRTSRTRAAARMLAEAGAFPKAGAACLEVGFGSLGWLAELLCWGVRQKDLHGIELDAVRVARAQEILPEADLRTGDATRLPWETDRFRLVIASTVFTSILDARVRRMVAADITRVLAPGGALLWYDFAVNNPRNPNVRRVGRKELQGLVPELRGSIRSVTLAPPLVRLVAPKSWLLATALEAFPFLRTHLLAVLLKRS